MGVGVILGLGLDLACEFLLLDLGVHGEAVSWPLLTQSCLPSLPGAPVRSPAPLLACCRLGAERRRGAQRPRAKSPLLLQLGAAC